MENSYNQVNQIIEKRKQMLNQMGVANAGQMMQETMVSNPQNTNMLQKIQQIKSGAAKQELNKYISASGKNGGIGRNEFSPIPVPKPRNNPNAPTVKPEYKVNVDNFAPASNVDNSELSMFEAMFAGETRGGYQPNISANQFTMPQKNPNEISQIDLGATMNKMPVFDPKRVLDQKVKNNPLLKFAQPTPLGSPTDYMTEEQILAYQQNQYMLNNANQNNQPYVNQGITPELKYMMESIAKGIAEDTIKKVLEEFTGAQKNKLTYEYYNKQQNIIKSSDGNYYKLTKMTPKKSV